MKSYRSIRFLTCIFVIFGRLTCKTPTSDFRDLFPVSKTHEKCASSGSRIRRRTAKGMNFFKMIKSGPEIKDLVRKMSAPIKFYRAWTPQKAGLHYIGRNAPDARARKNFWKRWARAHSEKYLLTFAKRAGGPPAPWGGGPCARARARAKYPGLSKLAFFVI